MLVRVQNATEREEPAPVPLKDDGSAYRFEMIHIDGSWRLYADTHAELVGALIAGYDELDGLGRARARLRYCVDVQVRLQAALATPEALDECSAEDRTVVLGSRDIPPSPAEWAAPVPLVLVAAYYAPTGPRRRPEPRDGGEILWLDPSSDARLLTSLHHAGILVLAVSDLERGERG